jgi:hypothetical protein
MGMMSNTSVPLLLKTCYTRLFVPALPDIFYASGSGLPLTFVSHRLISPSACPLVKFAAQTFAQYPRGGWRVPQFLQRF